MTPREKYVLLPLGKLNNLDKFVSVMWPIMYVYRVFSFCFTFIYHFSLRVTVGTEGSWEKGLR